MKAITFLLVIHACILGYGQANTDRPAGGACEDCALIYEGMPQILSWETAIAAPTEPGERMVITGTIYQHDGKTPAPGVILYIYHTDAKGLYSPAPYQTKAKKHGHLRGWIKTNAKGQYQFTTIRPAGYPGRNAPQHIHPIIKEPGVTAYWIDEFVFADDPLLTAEEKRKFEKRGGSGIIVLQKNAGGNWEGKRNITLGNNIPGY